MTPDIFQQAQQLFLEVIKMPEGERVDYVQIHAESAEIGAEVLSLLRFHDNETLLPETATSLASIPGAIQDTVEFVSGQGPATIQPREASSTTGLLEIDPVVDVTERFVQSTNQLLRKRLIAATLVLSGLMVVVTIAAALFDNIVPIRLGSRCVTVSLLVGCGWYLKHHFSLHRHLLRGIELLIVTIPLIELSLIQWFESTELLSEGKAIQIEELRAIVFAVASIYIAIYGMFIPSNWRRTAVVTGFIALVPTVISVVHQLTHDYPPEVQWMHFANPTLIAAMAIIATVGSGIVHQVRREVESARYYGQYQLLEEIGRGGMGIAYLGKHQMLKRPAAIKLIRTEAAGSPQAIAQFEKEVQATATLSHWNTVQIYDYGTTEDGDFYCVMEYLVGVTLQQRIVQQIRQRELITVEKTLEIIDQLCDGLVEAHEKGLIHRDIKPANVFLAEIGGFPDVVKLLDFGLVVNETETKDKDRTPTGGTPAYMSPEQIRGDALDGRSDIYAIGCVMFECLTGSPPFQSFPITQLLSDHLFRTPRLDAVAKIDARLPPILEKCLAKDRNNRFPDVASLRDACRQLQ